MAQVILQIPLAYNAGEWRISKQVIGPRGGKSWTKVVSQPATGGEYHTDLEQGIYKETHWSNGWPTSTVFVVSDDGVVTYEDESAELTDAMFGYDELTDEELRDGDD